MPLSLPEFVTRWKASTLSERAAGQTHFIDLCNVLSQPHPAAARKLVEKLDAWLNPPDATPDELKKRTLTNLYNARPTWLAEAHRKLDAAVFAGHGWPTTLTHAENLEHLLSLNHVRAASHG